MDSLAALIGLLLLVWWYLYRKSVAAFLHGASEDIRVTLDKRRMHYRGFYPAQTDSWYLKTLRLLTSRWVLGLIFTLLLFIWLGWQMHVMWRDIFITGSAGGGEPFSWYEGVSIWPSVLLRIVTGLLALCFLLLGIQRLHQNDERLTELFFPGYKNTVLFRRRPSFDVRIWYAFKRKFISHDLPQGRIRPKHKDANLRRRQAVLIWRNAVQPRSLFTLFGRMVIGVIVLMTAAYLLLALLPSEPPNTPYRGDVGRDVHFHTIIFAIFSFVFLLVFVIESTRRTCCLATCLGDRNATKWPKGTEQWFGYKHRQLPLCEETGSFRYHHDWLDIQLIASRTVVVGSFIYYPFLILSLIILARSSFFDNLQIPVGLGTLFIMYLIIALACAMALRHAAERARKHALRNISEEMVQALGNDACRQ